MKLPAYLRASALGFLGLLSATAPAASFSLTGTYEGYAACDSTTDAEASSWGWKIELLIVQDGDNLAADFKFVEQGENFTLYSGKAATSADGSLVSAYFKACDGGFPADELVRMFPSSTKVSPFNFAADGVWVSEAVPNRPGLTVQSCRWAFTRTSTEAPTVQACPQP